VAQASNPSKERKRGEFKSPSFLIDMTKWMLYILTLIVVVDCAACARSTEQTNNHSTKSIKTKIEWFPTKPFVQTYSNKKNSSKSIKSLEGIIPDNLYIPAVRIHAIVEPVSISENGQMGVPQSTDRVGYLSSGVLPGAIGNAIMDGHVDNYKGPAVFFHLKKLKKGDRVIVDNYKGCHIQFVVESVEIFKTSEAPLQKIFGQVNESRLNLITCTGKYSRKRKEHEARLVVFTKRLTETAGCKKTIQ
jgi:LPXTG-site transpeptidase (sortase) family protein